MVLHNRAAAAANVSSDFGSALGLAPGAELCVRDLFSGATQGPVANVSFALEAHDVAALRLSMPPCGR